MMQNYISCYANGANDTWGLQSMPNASEIMINHLDNYIREVDFSDAQARGVNMVRIPVAFWMFIETQGDEPYWTDSRQKDYYLPRLLGWAQKYDMEVLIDIHALPGGQNTDEHSGRNLVTAGLSPQFWNSTNLARGNDTVDAVLEWIQGLNDTLRDTIAIIELVNEPTISASGAYESLVGYYLANQAKVAAQLPDVWTMISDAWLGTSSWGTVFNTSQKVVMDLHWWNMFGAPPSLPTLEQYCNLTDTSTSTTPSAWKNPVLIGEFAAAQNNASLLYATTDAQKLQFYQQYYGTQLWAARGSGGATPLYRGAFYWSMVCTNCGPVWEPYYVVGASDTLAFTEPNWCESGSSSSSTSIVQINKAPEHTYDSCGVYQDSTSGTATASSGSSTATSTKTGASRRLCALQPSFMVVVLALGVLFVV